MKRLRNGIINILLVLVSFSLPFVVADCYPRDMPAPAVANLDYDGVGAIGMPPGQTIDMTWDEEGNSPVHYRSDNSKLVYEIRPNLDIYNHKIRTNSLGYRGPEISIEKPDDVFRICVVGDSVTFGWSELEENTYPHLLQEMLNEMPSTKGRRYEVVNMGVGGYNSEQELEVLKSKALPLDPDLILVQYCVNDIEVGADAGLWHHFTSTGVPVIDYIRHRGLQLYELVQDKDIVERNYIKMLEVAEDAEIPLAFILFPPLGTESNPIFVAHSAMMKEKGWPHLNLYPAFNAGDWNALMADGYHPAPAGYALAAAESVDYLVQHQLVPIDDAAGTSASPSPPPVTSPRQADSSSTM